MGDILFSFNGRLSRFGYLINIVGVGAAIAAVVSLQQYLGEWKFASILVTVAAVLPVIIYIAGVSKRFQDRGLHPIWGFLFYYLIPIGILFGAQQVLGAPLVNPETFADELRALPSTTAWTQELIVKWGALAFAALLFLVGQISILFRKGTAGPNAFDREDIPNEAATI